MCVCVYVSISRLIATAERIADSLGIDAQLILLILRLLHHYLGINRILREFNKEDHDH